MIKYIKTPLGYKRLSFFSRLLYSVDHRNPQGFVWRERILMIAVVAFVLVDFLK